MSAKVPTVLPRGSNQPQNKQTNAHEEWTEAYEYMFSHEKERAEQHKKHPFRIQTVKYVTFCSLYLAPQLKRRLTLCTRGRLNPLYSRGSTFEKRRPRNIMKDKEELYDNAIQLKRHTNMLREENIRLKSKIQQYEEDSAKKSKLLQEMMSQIANTNATPRVPAYHKEV